MEDNKLQHLTEKLYNEGISKANEEAEKIVREAKEKAERIVKEAQENAEQIKQKSEKNAEDQKRQVETDLQKSAHQTLRTVKQQIENLITAKVVEPPIKKSFSDTDFVKKLIEEAVNNWSPDKEQVSLSILLPDNYRKDLESYFEANTHKILQAGLDVQFTTRFKAGFKIGPADGSYKISFKEEDFENLFKSFLRPKTTELLFSEQK